MLYKSKQHNCTVNDIVTVIVYLINVVIEGVYAHSPVLVTNQRVSCQFNR